MCEVYDCPQSYPNVNSSLRTNIHTSACVSTHTAHLPQPRSSPHFINTFHRNAELSLLTSNSPRTRAPIHTTLLTGPNTLPRLTATGSRQAHASNSKPACMHACMQVAVSHFLSPTGSPAMQSLKALTTSMDPLVILVAIPNAWKNPVCAGSMPVHRRSHVRFYTNQFMVSDAAMLAAYICLLRDQGKRRSGKRGERCFYACWSRHWSLDHARTNIDAYM